MKFRTFQVSTVLLLSVVQACSNDSPIRSINNCSTRGCPSGYVCGDDDVCIQIDDGTGGAGGGDPRGNGGSFGDVAPTSITIAPTTVDLVSTNGSTPTASLSVLGTYSDGSTGAVGGATWSVADPEIGTVDGSGTFTASGRVGGEVLVTVTRSTSNGALTATATVTVRLQNVHNETEVANPSDMFDNAPVGTDAGATPTIVYPLDGVVVPQNVYPMDVQWDLGATGDLFRVTLNKPNVSVVSYLRHNGNPSQSLHWLVHSDSWLSLARTDVNDDAQLTVERLVASTGTRFASSPVHVRFAKAALVGTVYYWDVEAGRSKRINDGEAFAEDYMPNPPAVGGTSCIGCHAVSRSGNKLVGRHGGGATNVGTVYDLTSDLTTNPPEPEFPLTNGWAFAAWNPDDTNVIVGGSVLNFLDPTSGAITAPIGVQPGGGGVMATQPAWSPDGRQIVYVAGNQFGTNISASEVRVVDYTEPNTLSNDRLLHQGATQPSDIPSSDTDAYPTWSPDSRLIAFAHGPASRSQNQHNALFVMNRDGSNVVRLDNAIGDGDDAKLAFQPSFSPFQQDGYYWLGFLSRRHYGNAHSGHSEKDGKPQQQIWITAIKANTSASEDPSSVPYWVSGQGLDTANLSVFWAERACVVDGETCETNDQCCGGSCGPDDTGAMVCNPSTMCRPLGATCAQTSDCCSGSATCVANVCAVIVN